MKKLLVIQLFTISSSLFSLCTAQNPTYQQKLFYTCKIWGFIKYFHSRVSVCEVNWDSVLIADLPLVKSAVTKNDFNNALDTIFAAAGTMALTSSPPCDTMGPEYKRNLNFGWINDTILRGDVQTILDTIKNNFRPHSECWVETNPNEADGGWLKFIGGDSLMLNINDFSNFPDEPHRLFELFAYWNIINYFNPYNYIHDIPWDSSLSQNIIALDTASNDQQFYYALRRLTSQNDDAHTEGLTYDGYCSFPNGMNADYCPKLILKYIPNQYVVIKSGITGLLVGDAIVSVNGLTTKEWEDSLRNYVSTGDTAVFRRTICSYMLYGDYAANCNIVYFDSLNNSHSITTTCSISNTSSYLNTYDYVNGYFANDTLGATHYTIWNNCNVGYVNMGELQLGEEPAMYSDLEYASSIIFDLRDYPNGTAWNIANLIYPNQITFAEFQIPDPTYPGTYYLSDDYLGYNSNPTPYNGQIILLFNELTQSQAEFTCMVFGVMPNVVKIGSQTAGTDGDITYFNLSEEMQTGFTTLGTFYANGDSTERIGIKPDTIVYPTRSGLYHQRDEVLEKALQIAGCPLAIPSIKNSKEGMEVFPNPASQKVTVKLNNTNEEIISLKLTDIFGRPIITKMMKRNMNVGSTEININTLPSGTYILYLNTNSKQYISKIVKIK